MHEIAATTIFTILEVAVADAVGRYASAGIFPAVAECVGNHARARGSTMDDVAGAACSQACDPVQERIATACMDDIIGYAWHGEITDDADDHKNEVCGISGRKKGIPIILDLRNIYLEHILLHFADDAAKNIGDREPKKDVNVPCDPYRKRVLETIKDGDAKY